MTETADKLFNAGFLDKGLKVLSKAVRMYDFLYGKSNNFFDHVIKILNSKAVKLLNNGNVKDSLKILKKCENMIRKRTKFCSSEVKIECYNNLSLWFRKRGLFTIGLEYIDKALGVCLSQGYPPGRTYINYGAMQSVSGNHFLALEYTRNGVNALIRQLKTCNSEEKREIARLIILGFYNISAEEENLNHYENSLVSIENAVVLSENIFGVEDSLTLELAKQFKRNQKKLKRKMKEQNAYAYKQADKRKIKITPMPFNIKILRSIVNSVPVKLRGIKTKTNKLTKFTDEMGHESEESIGAGMNEKKKKLGLSFLANLKKKRRDSTWNSIAGENIKELLRTRRTKELELLKKERTMDLMKKLGPEYHVIVLQSIFRMILVRTSFLRKLRIKQSGLMHIFRKNLKIRIDPRIEGRVESRFEISCIYFFYQGFLRFKAKPSFHAEWVSLSVDLPTKELEISEKSGFGNFEKMRIQAVKLGSTFAQSLIILDKRLEFDAGKKLDNIMDEVAYLDLPDVFKKKVNKSFFKLKLFTGSPIKTEKEKKKNFDLSELENGSKLKSPKSRRFNYVTNGRNMNIIEDKYEQLVVTNIIIIQKEIRKYIAKKRCEGLRKIESIRVFKTEFNQGGETFFISIFKRLLNSRVTLYCWNLSIMERFKPLVLNITPELLTDYAEIWNKVYLSVDDNCLFYEDFWKTPADPIFPLDEREASKAGKFMLNYCRGKRFIQRVFQTKRLFRVIGKRTFSYKQNSFILIGSIKDKTRCLKIFLFSKRTHDITQNRLFYNFDSSRDLFSFSKERFYSCKVQPKKFENYYRMNFEVEKKFEFDISVKDNVKNMVVEMQRKLRREKIISCFEYVMKNDLVFPIYVYWLDKLGIILFKIYVLCDEDKSENLKNLSVFSFDSEEESQMLKKRAKLKNIETDTISMVENEEKSKMVMFQVLRISLEDLQIEKENIEKSSIERFIQLIVLHKLFYTNYFVLSYLEREEIFKYIYPKKFNEKKFLWKEELEEKEQSKFLDVHQVIEDSINRKREKELEKMEIGKSEIFNNSQISVGIKEFSKGRSPDWDKIDKFGFQFYQNEESLSDEDFETNELMTQLENQNKNDLSTSRMSVKGDDDGSQNISEERTAEYEIIESFAGASIDGEGEREDEEEASSMQSIIENKVYQNNNLTSDFKLKLLNEDGSSVNFETFLQKEKSNEQGSLSLKEKSGNPNLIPLELLSKPSIIEESEELHKVTLNNSSSALPKKKKFQRNPSEDENNNSIDFNKKKSLLAGAFLKRIPKKNSSRKQSEKENLEEKESEHEEEGKEEEEIEIKEEPIPMKSMTSIHLRSKSHSSFGSNFVPGTAKRKDSYFLRSGLRRMTKSKKNKHGSSSNIYGDIFKSKMKVSSKFIPSKGFRKFSIRLNQSKNENSYRSGKRTLTRGGSFYIKKRGSKKKLTGNTNSGAYSSNTSRKEKKLIKKFSIKSKPKEKKNKTVYGVKVIAPLSKFSPNHRSRKDLKKKNAVVKLKKIDKTNHLSVTLERASGTLVHRISNVNGGGQFERRRSLRAAGFSEAINIAKEAKEKQKRNIAKEAKEKQKRFKIVVYDD